MSRAIVKDIRGFGAVRSGILTTHMLWCTTALVAQQRVAVDPSRTAAAEAVLTTPVTVNFERVPVHDAIDLMARLAGVQIQYQTAQVESPLKRVTLHVSNMPLGVALTRVLDGTGLQVHALTGNHLAVVAVPLDQHVLRVQGSITGTIIDARTKQPIAGATVALDGAMRGVLSNVDGAFRCQDVAAGVHVITVKSVGYVRQTRRVMVQDDAVVSVDVALDANTNVLDQIVVTGTVVATERKAIPTAITVITAELLEERGVTKIDQLFHGDVPGVFAQNQGSNDVFPGRVPLASRGATSFAQQTLAQPLKTYVDGVELSDPSYVGLIDPKSIERIEILTGPQASTIYGSNAINGVMQIFTKRGTTSHPEWTVHLQSGLIQNNFSSALTSQHDYSTQVAGVEGHISYSMGGAWRHVGPWTPAIRATTVSGFGAARLQQGLVIADVNMRRVFGTNWQNGDVGQTTTALASSGVYALTNATGAPVPTTNTTAVQTTGVTLTLVPMPWWSHTVTIGNDVTNTGTQARNFTYRSPSDTLLRMAQGSVTRTSVTYTSTVHVPFSEMVQGIVTAGADGWHTSSTTVNAFSPTLSGTLAGSLSIVRQPAHDHGAFVQGQLNLWDMIFLTSGLRAEWNPRYGDAANPNVVPRYGVSVTHDVGPVTAKVRASYGHATRPPGLNLANGWRIGDPLGPNYVPDLIPAWGNVYGTLPNPDLVPEQQRGGEGGLELYLGNHATLTATRYNQTVDNLIAQVIADSVLSLVPDPYGPGCCNGAYQYLEQEQHLNLGSIRNEGWEFHGSVNSGPFTVGGTYSWTKSRVIGITPKYRAQFPQYVPGATFAQLPEHTYAMNFGYARGGTSLSLNIQGQGMLYVNGLGQSAQYIGILVREAQAHRLPATESPRLSVPSGYVGRGPGYALGDAHLSQHLSSRVDGTLHVQNVANLYRSDTGFGYAAIGRQTNAGLTIHW